MVKPKLATKSKAPSPMEPKQLKNVQPCMSRHCAWWDWKPSCHAKAIGYHIILQMYITSVGKYFGFKAIFANMENQRIWDLKSSQIHESNPTSWQKPQSTGFVLESFQNMNRICCFFSILGQKCGKYPWPFFAFQEEPPPHKKHKKPHQITNP